ncbi:hypothetical protein CBR_g29987 [Chara braunii]|uniref:DUF659 domain-containing protein n=1 Tax=Chara braunii TaxID=69332 RepID=A0A388LC06_CHABU|nr:hypothetical protein CBR_g29987 [Chara braunii]|eukprot:GBG79723.1 hypothetical protein CBR_g29987 [Chara braunii]
MAPKRRNGEGEGSQEPFKPVSSEEQRETIARCCIFKYLTKGQTLDSCKGNYKMKCNFCNKPPFQGSQSRGADHFAKGRCPRVTPEGGGGWQGRRALRRRRLCRRRGENCLTRATGRGSKGGRRRRGCGGVRSIPARGGFREPRAGCQPTGHVAMDGRGKRRADTAPTASAPEPKRLKQVRLDEVYGPEWQATFDHLFVQWWYISGIPFETARMAEYGALSQHVLNMPRGVKPALPQFRRIAGNEIQEERLHIADKLRDIRGQMDHTGVTILIDGRKSLNFEPIINFLAVGQSGAFLYTTVRREGVDAETADVVLRRWKKVFEDFGAKKINAICTDSASVYVAAGRALRDDPDPDIRRIPWLPCSVHCCNLMLSDMVKDKTWAIELLTRARAVVHFIMSHGSDLALFRIYSARADRDTRGGRVSGSTASGEEARGRGRRGREFTQQKKVAEMTLEYICTHTGFDRRGERYRLVRQQLYDFHSRGPRYDWGGDDGTGDEDLCQGVDETQAIADCWVLHGGCAPELCSIATRLMYTWVCASPAQRNWALDERIHEKRHNGLDFMKLTEMVEMCANKKLLTCRARRRGLVLPWGDVEEGLDDVPEPHRSGTLPPGSLTDAEIKRQARKVHVFRSRQWNALAMALSIPRPHITGGRMLTPAGVLTTLGRITAPLLQLLWVRACLCLHLVRSLWVDGRLVLNLLVVQLDMSRAYVVEAVTAARLAAESRHASHVTGTVDGHNGDDDDTRVGLDDTFGDGIARRRDDDEGDGDDVAVTADAGGLPVCDGTDEDRQLDVAHVALTDALKHRPEVEDVVPDRIEEDMDPDGAVRTAPVGAPAVTVSPLEHHAAGIDPLMGRSRHILQRLWKVVPLSSLLPVSPSLPSGVSGDDARSMEMADLFEQLTGQRVIEPGGVSWGAGSAGAGARPRSPGAVSGRRGESGASVVGGGAGRTVAIAQPTLSGASVGGGDAAAAAATPQGRGHVEASPSPSSKGKGKSVSWSDISRVTKKLKDAMPGVTGERRDRGGRLSEMFADAAGWVRKGDRLEHPRAGSSSVVDGQGRTMVAPPSRPPTARAAHRDGQRPPKGRSSTRAPAVGRLPHPFSEDIVNPTTLPSSRGGCLSTAHRILEEEPRL